MPFSIIVVPEERKGRAEEAGRQAEAKVHTTSKLTYTAAHS